MSPQNTPSHRSARRGRGFALTGAGEPGQVPKSSEPTCPGLVFSPVLRNRHRGCRSRSSRAAELLPRTPAHLPGRCWMRMFIISLVPSVR